MESPVIEPIFEDYRGASWSIKFPDGTEAILIYTNKGALRGGHSHNSPETSLILSGRMKYKKKYPDGHEEEFEHGPGQPLYNAPGEIHMARALESGWLFDWKIGVKMGEAVTTNYAPYRQEVDAQVKEHTEMDKNQK